MSTYVFRELKNWRARLLAFLMDGQKIKLSIYIDQQKCKHDYATTTHQGTVFQQKQKGVLLLHLFKLLTLYFRPLLGPYLFSQLTEDCQNESWKNIYCLQRKFSFNMSVFGGVFGSKHLVTQGSTRYRLKGVDNIIQFKLFKIIGQFYQFYPAAKLNFWKTF